MLFGPDRIREIFDQLFGATQADELHLYFSNESPRYWLRFASGEISHPGLSHEASLTITASFGKRSGSVTVTQFDREALLEALRQAEEIARMAPEDPEHMPVLGPQTYLEVPQAFSEETAEVTPEALKGYVETALTTAKRENVIPAGILYAEAGEEAVGTSKGLFGYHRATGTEFTVTARTLDGTGSGWARGFHVNYRELKPSDIAGRAIDKAATSRKPQDIEPGEYTVILEPAAVASLIGWVLWHMDARAADEGRSAFSKPGGGNRTGEQVASKLVTLRTDPTHPLVLGRPFDREGLPVRPRVWIEKGVLKTLYYTRYWAQKQGVEPTGYPHSIVMEGIPGRTIYDLLNETKDGIVITRLWYIRLTDPRTLSLTGVTRDGTFRIQSGDVLLPLKNLRFNISMMEVLKNIVDMTEPQTVATDWEVGAYPAVKVKNFRFTAVSEAI